MLRPTDSDWFWVGTKLRKIIQPEFHLGQVGGVDPRLYIRWSSVYHQESMLRQVAHPHLDSGHVAVHVWDTDVILVYDSEGGVLDLQGPDDCRGRSVVDGHKRDVESVCFEYSTWHFTNEWVINLNTVNCNRIEITRTTKKKWRSQNLQKYIELFSSSDIFTSSKNFMKSGANNLYLIAAYRLQNERLPHKSYALLCFSFPSHS